MIFGEQRAMVVAGVMSGTSADGVDVALVRVSPGKDDVPKLKVVGHREFRYPKALRAEVLRVMEGEAMPAAAMSRLNWRLGSLYAECVEKAVAALGVRAALVGMHGQTVFHEAGVATWQMGEAAVVAERLRVPVVSDFRPADMAAGGQAAPLVPMPDYCLFRSASKNRVLLNLGGIANMTAIPAGAGLDGVIAFDSGPANMVVDALMQREFGKAFDRGGKVAARGQVVETAVRAVLAEPYFGLPAPKSCGREQFGAAFAERLASLCAGSSGEDLVASATALTWRSIYDAYARMVWPHLGQRAPLARATELIVAGGGVRNAFLMRRLTEAFGALGVKVMASDEAGVEAQAKEAVAFGLLAWLSWHGLPGNVPAATGAKRAVVLGKISLA